MSVIQVSGIVDLLNVYSNQWQSPAQAYTSIFWYPLFVFLIFFDRVHCATLIGVAFPASLRTSSMVKVFGSFAKYASAFGGPVRRVGRRTAVFLPGGRPTFRGLPAARGLPGP